MTTDEPDTTPTILVVEDDRGLNNLIQKTLQKNGFSTDGVHSGKTAIARVGRSQDVILLMDYKLPDMDGKELLDRLTTKGLSVPFITMTGHGDEGTAVRMMKLGAREYLIKDATFMKILPRVVKRVVRELGDERDLRNMKERLRESEERHHRLFQKIPIGLYQTGPNGEKIDANPAFARLLGYPDVAAYLETSVEGEYVDARDYERWKELLEKTDVLTDFEVRQRRTDGEVIWVRENSRVVRDPEGQILYYEGSVEDITERKRAEETIQGQNEFMRTILDSLSYPFYVINVDDYSIEIANRAAGKDVAGKASCHALLHNSDAPCSGEMGPCPVQVLRKTGQPAVMEHLHHDENGVPRHEEIHVHPILDERGEVVQVIEYSIDITERKKAEEALKEREQLLRTIAENYPNSSLSIINRDLMVGYTAGQEFRNQGLDPDDFTGRSIEEVFGSYGDEVVSKARDMYLETFKGKETSFELQVGDQYQLYKAVPLPDEDGEVDRILSVVENITERKKVETKLEEYQQHLEELVTRKTRELVQINKSLRAKIREQQRAEKALQESEERMVAMMNNASSVIYLKDLEGRYLLINRRFEELFGFANQEIMGKTGYDVFPTGIADAFRAHDLRVLEAGKAVVSEEVVPHEDGVHTYISVKFPLLDSTGNPYAIGGISTDITQRKKMEEAIQESEARYRRLFEESSDAIFIHDLEGKILDVNRQACEMMGHSRDRLLSMRLPALHPEDARPYVEMTLRGVKDEGSIHFESRFQTADDSIIHVDISARIVDAEKGHVQGVVRDITEQKRAEMEMKRRLMRFRLDEGILYLVQETLPVLSREALSDLLTVGYHGIVVSRTPEERLRLDLAGSYESLWFASEEGEGVLPPDPGSILSWIEGLPRRTVLLMEDLHYLFFSNEFRDALSFILRLRELSYRKGMVVVLSLDPSTLSAVELRQLEKEAMSVEPVHKTMLSSKVLDILRYVYQRNLVGTSPTYGDIGRKLGISKPTVGKRLGHLISEGYLKLEVRGNRKAVELTDRGMSMLSK